MKDDDRRGRVASASALSSTEGVRSDSSAALSSAFAVKTSRIRVAKWHATKKPDHRRAIKVVAAQAIYSSILNEFDFQLIPEHGCHALTTRPRDRSPFDAGKRLIRDGASVSASPHPAPHGSTTAAVDLRGFAKDFDPASLVHAYPYMAGAVPSRLLAHHAGRLCAATAIAGLVADGDWCQPLLRGPAGEPLWPPGIVGSITHTAEFACAIAAPASTFAGIGIDSERRVDESTCSDIAAVCLTPAERQHFLRGTSIEQCWTATILFCIKEAFYKAAYSRAGRYIDFDELEVTRIDMRTRRVQARTEVLDRDARTGLHAAFFICDGFVHACVVLSNDNHPDPFASTHDFERVNPCDRTLVRARSQLQ